MPAYTTIRYVRDEARELYFPPEKFGADDALRIELVSRVLDDDACAAGVAALMTALAGAAPLALRAMKQNVVAAERMGCADYVDFESERHLRIAASADTREAFAAFVGKRPPRFQGR